MANPLYQMLNGGTGMSQQYQLPYKQQMNPVQQANAIYKAIQNPAAFVRQAIPDLPPEISNDPNKILQYLQQTRGITNDQISQIANMMPRF